MKEEIKNCYEKCLEENSMGISPSRKLWLNWTLTRLLPPPKTWHRHAQDETGEKEKGGEKKKKTDLYLHKQGFPFPVKALGLICQLLVRGDVCFCLSCWINAPFLFEFQVKPERQSKVRLTYHCRVKGV